MNRSITPYVLLTVASLFFSGWLLLWGLGQGPVGDISKVSPSFSLTNVIGSILFFISAWFVFHKGSKNPDLSIKVLVGLILWYIVVLFLGLGEFFAARPLFAPNIIFAFILLFIIGKKVLALSSLQNAFASVPLHWVFTVQVFRVMGVGFLSLYVMQILPGEFAIPTGIGDILIGATAPLAAYFYVTNKPYARKLAIFWNYAGIADLVMAITLGIATYSKPFQLLPTTIPNDPIALYPLILIPVFAVPLSIMIHLFSLRVLMEEEHSKKSKILGMKY